jgi:hypothetical protein
MGDARLAVSVAFAFDPFAGTILFNFHTGPLFYPVFLYFLQYIGKYPSFSLLFHR